MGELIRKHGQVVKIGTCEDLYYTTYEKFLNAYKRGFLSREENNDTPINYLTKGYRFRFPFPDEDNLKIGETGSFDCRRGVLFSIPNNLEIITGHEDITMRTDKQGIVAPNICITFLCPKAPNKLKIKEDIVGEGHVIFEVIQQKLVYLASSIYNPNPHYELQVCVRCPYCGAVCRLSKEEVHVFISYVRKNKKQFTEQQIEIVKRIAKGYIYSKDRLPFSKTERL